MSVKRLTEHHLEFLSFKGVCTASSESIHVKMPHCWKSKSRLIIYVPENGGLDLIASTSSESSDESVHIHFHKCDDDKNECKTINSYALISDN